MFSVTSKAYTKTNLSKFQLLNRELAEEGYSGVEIRATPIRTEVIIRATRTQNVLGEKGRRIRELTSVVQKRFGFPEVEAQSRRPTVHSLVLMGGRMRVLCLEDI